jgi:hypothetical protein
VLYQKESATDGHSHRVMVNGKILPHAIRFSMMIESPWHGGARRKEQYAVKKVDPHLIGRPGLSS